jgi:hypothetical protein
MEQHKQYRAVVWVDADAVFHRKPTLFRTLKADVAVHWREGIELLSGTMWWRNNATVRQAVEQWAKWCEQMQDMHLSCPEQQILQGNISQLGLRVYDLPTEYCKIYDLEEANDKGRVIDPMIVHYQHSRATRMAESLADVDAAAVAAEPPLETIDILVPTRERPERLRELLTSVRETASDMAKVRAYCYVDDNDGITRAALPVLEVDYPWVHFRIGPRLTISGDWWNKLWEVSSGDILFQAGDDLVFKSEGWDDRVREQFRSYPDHILLVYGDDGINGEKHASHAFVSRHSTKILRYYLPRHFEHLYNDTWLMELYRMAGRIVYDGKIVMDHRHFSKYPELWDETYADRRSERKSRSRACWEATAHEREEHAAILRAACVSTEAPE